MNIGGGNIQYDVHLNLRSLSQDLSEAERAFSGFKKKLESSPIKPSLKFDTYSIEREIDQLVQKLNSKLQLKGNIRFDTGEIDRQIDQLTSKVRGAISGSNGGVSGPQFMAHWRSPGGQFAAGPSFSGSGIGFAAASLFGGVGSANSIYAGGRAVGASAVSVTATMTKQCPNCRHSVPGSATFCPYCQYSFTGATPAQSTLINPTAPYVAGRAIGNLGSEIGAVAGGVVGMAPYIGSMIHAGAIAAEIPGAMAIGAGRAILGHGPNLAGQNFVGGAARVAGWAAGAPLGAGAFAVKALFKPAPPPPPPRPATLEDVIATIGMGHTAQQQYAQSNQDLLTSINSGILGMNPGAGVTNSISNSINSNSVVNNVISQMLGGGRGTRSSLRSGGPSIAGGATPYNVSEIAGGGFYKAGRSRNSGPHPYELAARSPAEIMMGSRPEVQAFHAAALARAINEGDARPEGGMYGGFATENAVDEHDEQDQSRMFFENLSGSPASRRGGFYKRSGRYRGYAINPLSEIAGGLGKIGSRISNYFNPIGPRMKNGMFNAGDRSFSEEMAENWEDIKTGGRFVGRMATTPIPGTRGYSGLLSRRLSQMGMSEGAAEMIGGVGSAGLAVTAGVSAAAHIGLGMQANTLQGNEMAFRSQNIGYMSGLSAEQVFRGTMGNGQHGVANFLSNTPGLGGFLSNAALGFDSFRSNNIAGSLQGAAFGNERASAIQGGRFAMNNNALSATAASSYGDKYAQMQANGNLNVESLRQEREVRTTALRDMGMKQTANLVAASYDAHIGALQNQTADQIYSAKTIDTGAHVNAMMFHGLSSTNSFAAGQLGIESKYNSRINGLDRLDSQRAGQEMAGEIGSYKQTYQFDTNAAAGQNVATAMMLNGNLFGGQRQSIYGKQADWDQRNQGTDPYSNSRRAAMHTQFANEIHGVNLNEFYTQSAMAHGINAQNMGMGGNFLGAATENLTNTYNSAVQSGQYTPAQLSGLYQSGATANKINEATRQYGQERGTGGIRQSTKSMAMRQNYQFMTGDISDTMFNANQEISDLAFDPNFRGAGNAGALDRRISAVKGNAAQSLAGLQRKLDHGNKAEEVSGFMNFGDLSNESYKDLDTAISEGKKGLADIDSTSASTKKAAGAAGDGNNPQLATMTTLLQSMLTAIQQANN